MGKIKPKKQPEKWEKDFDKLWLPDKKFKGRPEYKPAIKLCNEQKKFIRKTRAEAIREERVKMGKALRMEKQPSPTTLWRLEGYKMGYNQAAKKQNKKIDNYLKES